MIQGKLGQTVMNPNGDEFVHGSFDSQTMWPPMGKAAGTTVLGVRISISTTTGAVKTVLSANTNYNAGRYEKTIGT